MNLFDHALDMPVLVAGALGYFLACATVGGAVVALYARGWSAWRCICFSFGVWIKPAMAFLFAYAALFLDSGSGDLSVFFFAPFLLVGPCLLSTALAREGFSPRFPGAGALSTICIFVATLACCVRAAI